jgi:hypothetical protein
MRSVAWSRWARIGLLVPLVVWACLTLWAATGMWGALAWAGAMAGVWVGAPRRVGYGIAGVLCGLPLLALLVRQPSNDRVWEEQASRAPFATFDGSRVTVHDIRSFRWRSDGTAAARWKEQTFDLDTLVGSSFVLTDFGPSDAIAHVMVSFEFADEAFLVISVEIRRERGETYDPIRGMFRQYEVLYFAADEEDAIGLRTLVHGDPTWVIPMGAGPEATRRFLVDMLHRMNELHGAPEWYHTFLNSCSSNLARHYERINGVRLGWDRRIFLPGYSDRLLDELGLLPEDLT